MTRYYVTLSVTRVVDADTQREAVTIAEKEIEELAGRGNLAGCAGVSVEEEDAEPLPPTRQLTATERAVLRGMLP